MSAISNIPKLPGDDPPQLRFWVLCGAMAGLAIMAIPPPRAFMAIASDVIQTLGLFGALLVALLAALTTFDPGADGSFNEDATEFVGKELMKMRGKLYTTLLSYGTAIITVILAKIGCTWFEPHHWAWWIGRAATGISGATIGIAVASSLRLFNIQGSLQTLIGMRASIRHMGKPTP